MEQPNVQFLYNSTTGNLKFQHKSVYLTHSVWKRNDDTRHSGVWLTAATTLEPSRYLSWTDTYLSYNGVCDTLSLPAAPFIFNWISSLPVATVCYPEIHSTSFVLQACSVEYEMKLSM